LIEWLFWISLFLILYPYFGYPLLLFLISLARKKSVQKKEIAPLVSIIIAVYNEEKVIRRKIENILSLDYPHDKFEILVISDCSTDSTDQIVKQFETSEVKITTLKQRMGKHYAQKIGISQANGEIIAFTDAAPLLEREALSNIIKNFADPTVGCVTSEDRVFEREGSQGGEGTYIKYEMLLRRLESQICSVVGLSGSFFAVRKELCQNWPEEYSSDFLLALRSFKQGFRAVNDSSSIHYYRTVSSSTGEFERKVRTVMNGLAVLFENLGILNIFQYGFFSVEMLSHKLLRWLIPFFLLLLFASNIFLINQANFYLFFFMAQILFYALAGWAFIFLSLNKFRIFRIPSFFCLANSAILFGWLGLVKGRVHTVWQPSQRE
jgi:glycosyltransferase involved in cell wall biosynthesis